MDEARTWVPRAVALVSFAVYAIAAPSGVYWLDSAELSAAAAQMGSPHPTGFPLYCIVAKAASLVPFGEVAFRINLVSAGCAALAVLWITRLVCESCRDDVAALAGGACAGLTLATSLTFFRQATVAEVYAPTAALMAGALLLYLRVSRGAGPREGLALAVVAGLGLTVHTSFLLLGPVLFVLYMVRLRRGARWTMMAPLLVVVVAGATYAYLPVRSATGRTASVDWDHPREASGLIEHVSARRIRDAYSKQMRSTNSAVVLDNASVFAGDAAHQLGPIALLAALAGFAWLARERKTRWLFAAIALIALGDAVYAFWINPMGLADWQNGVPFALAMCVAAGAGVAWFARSLGRAAPFAGGFAGVALVVPAAFVSMPQVFAASSGDLPRAHVEASLDAVPPRGIALVQSDSMAAGMIYLTTVEMSRPDVAVIARQHLLGDAERTRAMLERSGGDSLADEIDDPWTWVLSSGRRIAWELGNDPTPYGWTLDVGAPMSRLVKGDEGLRGDAVAAAKRVHELFDHPSWRDRTARRMYAVALTNLGRVAYGRGDVDGAASLFEQALAVRPEHVVALINRGVIAARRRDFERALELTERALIHEPNRVAALINAGRYSIRLADDDAARGYLDRALGLAPDNASALALSALLDLRAGDPDSARARLERAEKSNPRNPDLVDVKRQWQQNSR